jgi:hypothetical protein
MTSENKYDPYINEYESDEYKNSHNSTCQEKDPQQHWVDDFAYASTERLPIPDDAPHADDMIKLLQKFARKTGNAPIYRFVLVCVDAECGNIIVVPSPGTHGPGIINLLSRAVSILAFQDALNEEEILNKLGGMLDKDNIQTISDTGMYL